MTDSSETAEARFERIAPDLLEIRIKANARIGVEFVAAVMRERRRLCGVDALCVLVLVPPDAEVDTAVMGMDHYKRNESADGLRAVAIVSANLVMETMARLYAAYFPPMFRLEVFNQETDARHWVDEQLAQLRQAGQKA